MRAWIAFVSAFTALTISGVNLYFALKPDLEWCARYHMICHWGGRWELDPVWYSDDSVAGHPQERH